MTKKKNNVKSSAKQELSILGISFYFSFQQFIKYVFLYYKWNYKYSQILQPVDHDSLLITWWWMNLHYLHRNLGWEKGRGMWWETRYREWFHILGLMNSNKWEHHLQPVKYTGKQSLVQDKIYGSALLAANWTFYHMYSSFSHIFCEGTENLQISQAI